MEQTLDQSRQLDMLFEQMLLNRMNGTVDGNNIIQGTTMEPDVNVKAIPSYGIPLYDPLESCFESNSTWQSKFRY
jgi:hypothetical protein